MMIEDQQQEWQRECQQESQYSIFEYSKGERQQHQPLRFEDSLTPFPKYPYCTLGVLSSEAQWGTHKGIAYVVEDNYLLTCASNCYSDEHGQYPNITFTINSNRKHVYDTYKISKVFIPKNYKNLSYGTRKQFNYALLEIAGQPHLKDKYGFIEITFSGPYSQAPIYEENVSNSREQIQPSEYLSQNYPSACLSGTPILFEMQYTKEFSDGLIVEQNNSQFSILWFTDNMKNQLQQWTDDKRRELHLCKLKSEDLNRNFFSRMYSQTIQLLSLNLSQLNQQRFSQLFDRLPYRSISALLMRSNKRSLSLAFLRKDKFRDLKILQLNGCKIDPIGCMGITKASLENLRVLRLFQNQIGKEGCRCISLGKWPFLQRLEIGDCGIMCEGLEHICTVKWTNLNKLCLINNKLSNESSFSLERINYSYIQTLNVRDSLITWEFIHFLKSPPWKNLKDLNLSLNHIGNKGCKMIKESGILFYKISLCNPNTIKEGCHFDDIGVQWLCKGNLDKLKTLQIANNKFGDRGCCQLSKSKIPMLSSLKLEAAFLGVGQVRVRGFKWLFKTGWTYNTMFEAFGIFGLSTTQRIYCESIYRGDTYNN